MLFVVHAQLEAALEPRHHFADAVDIHDEPTVRSPELALIEALQQFLERAAIALPLEVGSRHADHAILDGREADVFLVHEDHATTGAQHDLAGLARLTLLE